MKKRWMGALVAALVAAALATTVAWAQESGTLIFEDSFESGVIGEFPEGWGIPDQSHHDEHGTGPQIVGPGTIAIPDGERAVRLESTPKPDGNDAKLTMEFDPASSGRITFYAFTPAENAGLLSIELRSGGERIGHIEFTSSYRYRDRAGDAVSTGIPTIRDDWFQLILEWDAEESVYHAFVRNSAGEETRITPEEGAPFLGGFEGSEPDGFHLRLNRDDEPGVVGFVDAVKVYALD